MGGGSPMVQTAVAFASSLEGFIRKFKVSDPKEKARLLIHHWLDGLACWSLEDLVLSTATMLEIIAATGKREGNAAGVSGLTTFNTSLSYSASRYGLTNLGPDFRNMRNDLVHFGALSVRRFAGKDKAACALAVVEALNWIDQYMHAALHFGPNYTPRFEPHAFIGLNAFSLD